MKSTLLAARLPEDLVRLLARVCKKVGLRRSAVIESALREKLEDLLDAQALNEAIEGATGFQTWNRVNALSRRQRRS